MSNPIKLQMIGPEQYIKTLYNLIANTAKLIQDKFAGGFSLLLKENGVYNITDTVNGAFDKDALICGEESDNALSVVGQGSSENNGRSDIYNKHDCYKLSLF